MYPQVPGNSPWLCALFCVQGPHYFFTVSNSGQSLLLHISSPFLIWAGPLIFTAGRVLSPLQPSGAQDLPDQVPGGLRSRSAPESMHPLPQRGW